MPSTKFVLKIALAIDGPINAVFAQLPIARLKLAIALASYLAVYEQRGRS